jgi:DNA-binding CsgD family transcriptional regulator
MLHTVELRDLNLGALTPKERECLRLVAQQRSSKEIARELGISKASVDTYCNRARAKLGVSSRRAAAQLVLQLESADAAPAPPPQPAAVASGPAVQVALLPPLSSLGPAARLGVILGGAVALALAFGMLLSGLQTLDGIVQAAHARAAAPAAVATD